MTATTSLAREARTLGGVAHPIASLIDLVVMPGMPGDLALPIDGFPSPGRGSTYDEAIRVWQAQATGRRVRTGIQFDQELRNYVRLHAPGQPEARALLAGRRELARSIHTLTAAGIEPAQFRTRDALTRLATDFWSYAETTIPGISSPREHLWVDPDEVAKGSTAQGRDVRTRVLDALTKAYGPTTGRRLIVHHGFYFYTPPQWAMFQLLRQIADVDQVFLVHDDGENPSFETWRRFFEPVWGMPTAVRVGQDPPLTPFATSFRDAINGRAVVAENLKGLRVLNCASPAELVREWAHEDTRRPEPRRFAADAPTVQRFARRLGPTGKEAPSLAQLPVGAFLLGLHDCIRAEPGQRASVALTVEALVDIVATGYLPFEHVYEPSQLAAAVRRAQQYFYGCDSGDQWRDRARHLVKAIEIHVAPRGAREPGANDVDRIQSAASNPLRLAPWADITLDEARLIETAITKIVGFADGLVARETVRLGAHIGFIRDQIERGLRALGESERATILAKLNGFSVGLDESLDAEGLADVVTMLLGRDADVDAVGEEADHEGSIGPLRSLDALGLRPAEAPVHVANLSEANFPASRPRRTWPFELTNLKPMNDGGPVDLISDLLDLRESTAALSDLYLMWLCLDGVDPDHGLTISWLSRAEGEKQYVSPLIGLLTIPDVKSDDIREVTGGVTTHAALNAGLNDSVAKLPPPATDDTVTAADVAMISPEAAASALACPRRHAIQWILGPSCGFEADYLQEMLYGNALNALIRQGQADALSAPNAANALWRYLTDGQRQSSLSKAVVKQGSPSAVPAWLFTLSGNATKTDRLSLAYQAAKSRRRPQVDDILGGDSAFLPPGIDDPETCKRCPVQNRCAVRVTPD
ncbi:hypothetical protein [Isoptericola sp. QY 916]|uniref:hypothetical protein n=1 Tax=Isoptericola sp. QY 916 TaxID=2782570 RepID=UPI003D2FD30A|nr:hypothetical protein [Isoptericola sp. QY 916]